MGGLQQQVGFDPGTNQPSHRTEAEKRSRSSTDPCGAAIWVRDLLRSTLVDGLLYIVLCNKGSAS